jgi:hypothetical protein
MQKRISDLPPILSPGIHQITMNWLQVNCVDAFPISRTRPQILAGFSRIIERLEELAIDCHLIVDGSYLTEEIEPLDIDFAVCVTPEFYENCTAAQSEYLHWIRDDFTIKETHSSDCYLCVEYPEGHPDWYEGIQNKAFWVNLFATSVVHKQVRGVGYLELSVGV